MLAISTRKVASEEEYGWRQRMGLFSHQVFSMGTSKAMGFLLTKENTSPNI